MTRLSTLWDMSTRDPIRRLNGAGRAEVFARSGGQCEHHSLTGKRCPATTGLHTDHVLPYGRGGPTTVENASTLCAWHNMLKGGRVPFGWELRRMERRRAAYFPEGVSPRVSSSR